MRAKQTADILAAGINPARDETRPAGPNGMRAAAGAGESVTGAGAREPSRLGIPVAREGKRAENSVPSTDPVSRGLDLLGAVVEHDQSAGH
jgi:hypothetical protein